MFGKEIPEFLLKFHAIVTGSQDFASQRVRKLGSHKLNLSKDTIEIPTAARCRQHHPPWTSSLLAAVDRNLHHLWTVVLEISQPGRQKQKNIRIRILPWGIQFLGYPSGVKLQFCLVFTVHPGKLTWNPQMEVWKMIFLFYWVNMRFHVSFLGCIICCQYPLSAIISYHPLCLITACHIHNDSSDFCFLSRCLHSRIGRVENKHLDEEKQMNEFFYSSVVPNKHH